MFEHGWFSLISISTSIVSSFQLKAPCKPPICHHTRTLNAWQNNQSSQVAWLNRLRFYGIKFRNLLTVNSFFLLFELYHLNLSPIWLLPREEVHLLSHTLHYTIDDRHTHPSKLSLCHCLQHSHHSKCYTACRSLVSQQSSSLYCFICLSERKMAADLWFLISLIAL